MNMDQIISGFSLGGDRIPDSVKELGFHGPSTKGWRKREDSEDMESGDVFCGPGISGYYVVKGLAGYNVGERRITCYTKSQAPEPPKGVLWADVIGLEEAKSELQEAIEAPFLHKEVFEAFGIKPPKGVLLYGPPGCGKTMLGKAAASAMAKVHGKATRDGFFYFNGAEMIGPGFSSEVDWVKSAFEKAEDFYKKNQYPAVLFFDECDSMLPDRRRTNFFVKNAVNLFLSKMDGMDECHAFIILATNNHHELDEAAVREGRIDRKIFVGPPSREAVLSIVESSFCEKPIQNGMTPKEYAEYVVGQIFRENMVIGDAQFSSFLNGANVTGIANRAAQFAFRTAMKISKQSGKVDKSTLWISTEHLDHAIDALFRDVRDMVEKVPKQGLQVQVTHKIEGREPGLEDWQ